MAEKRLRIHAEVVFDANIDEELITDKFILDLVKDSVSYINKCGAVSKDKGKVFSYGMKFDRVKILGVASREAKKKK